MQLFNRAMRIAKSYISERESSTSIGLEPTPENDDDELRRMIDELSDNSDDQRQDDEPRHNAATENARQMSKADARLILEVTPDSTTDEIKAAYRKKMKEYHPDKVSGLGADLRKLAQKKSQQINEAYEILSSSKTG